MEDFMRKTTLIAVAVLALFVAGCASTSFQSTWKAPDAGPYQLGGKKLVAIALAPKSARLAAEDAMVNKMKQFGSDGMQSYLILDLDASKDELKSKVQAEGFDGAIVMKVVKEDKELRSTNTGMYYGVGAPYPGGFYGYGWGWGMYSAPEIRTDTLVYVETLVYDVAGDRLIWAGRSKTTNPSSIEKFVGEVSDQAIKEMQKSGFVSAN
jgi:hypothetical protein